MEGADGQPEGKFSLADAYVACCVREWLAVVAKHVSFDECVKAAVESLSKGLQRASFGCTKIENPVVALGCFLEGATLYVGGVPMIAGAQQ